MEHTAVKAYGAKSAKDDILPLTIKRREVGNNDVEIKILFCGICHSDIHTAKNEWHNTTYPVVPGHEIVGTISKVGAQVKKFSIGDTVGVGCMVDSCRTCANCQKNLEQFCEKGASFTYNSPDPLLNLQTYGGYSQSIVVDADFVLSIPKNLDLKGVAPLLCAGITTFSPLNHWKVSAGQKVGIAGLGGLGHMGVKIAKALGAEVIVLTTSSNKIEDAKGLGASDVYLINKPEDFNHKANSLDFILDTISAPHDINNYLSLLKPDGKLVLVGAPFDPLPVVSFSLIIGRKSLAGSLIGGIKETQEMLDFCGKHNIISDIELIKPTEINQAYERVLKNDVKYRFVIDMSLLN